LFTPSFTMITRRAEEHAGYTLVFAENSLECCFFGLPAAQRVVVTIHTAKHYWHVGVESASVPEEKNQGVIIRSQDHVDFLILGLVGQHGQKVAVMDLVVVVSGVHILDEPAQPAVIRAETGFYAVEFAPRPFKSRVI